jgi:hypothetical protein
LPVDIAERRLYHVALLPFQQVPGATLVKILETGLVLFDMMKNPNEENEKLE